MNKRVFHGTTYKHYKEMVENNFQNTKDSYTWNCSDDNNIYFHVLSKYVENEGYDDDVKYAKKVCIERAFESSQITAGVESELDARLVVLELSIDEDLLEDDYSCENMEGISSLTEIQNLTLDNIRNVYLCEKGYNPALQVFVLQGLLENEWINLENVSSQVIEAMEIMNQNDVCLPIESLMEFDYIPIKY